MMHLTYSNRTEALLDALVRRLDARRREGADPLEPTWIVVPNRNVERYVELGVATRLGVAANLRFERLAGFVQGWLGDSLLLGDAFLARVLRGLLDAPLLEDPAMAPVRRYLAGAGDAPDAIDLRRAQLALHVAHLFEEYGFSRPELLAAWTADEARFVGTAHEAAEGWQRALFRFARAHPASEGMRTLDEALSSAGPPPAPEVQVFGLSYVARIFSRLFAELSQRCDLQLYALNPCEEFWEDLETEGELRRRRKRTSGAEPDWLFEDEDPFQLSVDTETPLLRLWGRPGREHVRLLDALTECDFTPAFVDPLRARASQDDALPLFRGLHEPTLLEHLQHDVLSRAPRRERPARDLKDDSVQVFACPSVRREVETVAAEIWSLVERTPDLTFDRIAVLVNGPDRDLYLPHIAAVFEEAHRIPFNVTDLSLSSVSPLLEGALRLVDLPMSRFTRPDVLGVVTHPAVRARAPEIDAHHWVELVDRLGIFHGLDREAHAGTYVEGDDLLSWEQGVTRIALGAFMSGARSGDGRFVSVAGGRYLPEEPALGDRGDARLALLLRSLMSDVRFAREAELSLSEWSRFLGELLSAYLTPTDEREETALRRALSAVQALSGLDLDGAKVRYPVAHELAIGRLEELGGGRGQHLADGVVVSSLMPMRAIPFRAIFVLGLGEGRFPASDRRDSMDLRAARRQAGDVTPPERDRYTFLETLLCARERLYLSYVARDEHTGDALSPSTVVEELLDVIDAGYLEGARGRIVSKPALKRHEAEGLARVLPQAGAEHRARQLGHALQRSLSEDGRAEALGAAGVSEATRRVVRDPALSRLLGLASIPERRRSERGARTLRLSLSALRKFLECPLQGWTRAVLRLEEDELHAGEASADEPFAPSMLDATMTLRGAFVDAALGRASMRDAYAARIAEQQAHGRWPLGAIAHVEAARHFEVLDRWQAAWDALGPAEEIARLRFGAAQAAEASERIADPIVLTFDDDPRERGSGRPLRVELVGRTELLRLGAARASVTPLLRRVPGQRGQVNELRYALRAFFDHAALSASGAPPARHVAAQLYGDQDGAGPVEIGFRALEATEAHAWLKGLVREMLGRSHAYLMPIEAVLRLADRVDDVRGEALVESVVYVAERWSGGQSRYGPVRDALAHAPPPPGEAEDFLERRFAFPLRSREGAR
ncbi:MAG: exodeoxyribonuclease V subunit gamma [Myxococcota bacterium]|nr:exodeoxyribonuclease V subunit gamma [Myxococcota bacterium]